MCLVNGVNHESEKVFFIRNSTIISFLPNSLDCWELCLHPEEPVVPFGGWDISRPAGGAGGAGRPAVRRQWPRRGEFWLLGEEEEEKEGCWPGETSDHRRCWGPRHCPWGVKPSQAPHMFVWDLHGSWNWDAKLDLVQLSPGWLCQIWDLNPIQDPRTYYFNRCRLLARLSVSVLSSADIVHLIAVMMCMTEDN